MAKKSKRTKEKKKRSLFHKVPSFLLWGLLSLVVIIYVMFFYKTFVGPYSYRWKAIFGKPIYPEGSVRGIDISHHQGTIDWEKLQNADLNGSRISFIFIKATEGANIMDENFNENFFHARKSGFVRGAYHFFTTKSSAEKQARFYCKIVQLEDGDLPPVLDIEPNTRQIANMGGKQALQKAVLEWLHIVENHYGVKPIIYASYKFKLDYLDKPEFNEYPYWIAHYYIEKMVYEGDWVFWQHTDVGKVPGINEEVDVNLFNGKLDELMHLTIKE